MRYGVALFVVSLLVGCYDRFDDAPKSTTPVCVTANATIKYLDQLLDLRDYLDVATDIVVSGRVTATDQGGNFYNSFMIQDDGYAVEILEGISGSFVRYPLGSVVAVSLNGLRLARYNSVLQLGLAAETGAYPVTAYMSHELIADQYLTNCGDVQLVAPTVVTLSDLMSGTLDPLPYGVLVRIDGVVLVADESEVVTWSGWLDFVDESGLKLLCYTSSYADFAQELVPRDTVSLVGILESYNDGSTTVNHLLLKMRTIDDCIIE
ncbi:MAG: DUF5689 domain-containing protein [Rikenellaceae bacterium]